MFRRNTRVSSSASLDASLDRLCCGYQTQEVLFEAHRWLAAESVRIRTNSEQEQLSLYLYRRRLAPLYISKNRLHWNPPGIDHWNGSVGVSGDERAALLLATSRILVSKKSAWNKDESRCGVLAP